MKDEKEIIVGLDIGTTKICAIVAEKTENNKINILGIGRTPSNQAVLRGMVINIHKTVEAIQYVVEEASKHSNVNIRTVHVGIAGQHIRSVHHRGQFIRDNTNSEINQQDIDRLVNDAYKLSMAPGEKILHVFPQEYIIDGEGGFKTPVGMAGIKLECNFHVITCQINAANNIHKCVTSSGLEMADLILEPIASADAVLSEDEKEAGVVLVDIGGGTTDVAIFEDGILRHTAVIPYGGEIITQDIRTGCNIMQKHAEQLKVQFGSAIASATKENVVIAIEGLKGREPKEIMARNLAHIIEARMTEILESVYFEIRSSGYEKKLQGGIVLTGGGAQLKHLPQLVEYITGIDARVGYPSEYLGKGMIDEVLNPAYATSIGLILNGVSQADNKNKKIVETIEAPIRTNLLKRIFRGPLKPIDDFLKDGQGDFTEK